MLATKVFAMPDGPRVSNGGPSVTHLAHGLDMRRTSSADHVALYIRRLIFDGDLRPGQRVPQDDIAETLGVSRIPVREALIALEREGWVTIELHRGAFINALDEASVRDHYELFGLIYGFAAQRALARPAAGEMLEVLDRIVKDLTKARGHGTFSRLAVDFHRTVVDSAHSNRIKVLVRAMSSLVPGDFFDLVPEAVAIERRGLPAVNRAIKSGDDARIAREYSAMMRRVGEAVVALFADRGLFSEPGGAAASGSRAAEDEGAT